MDSLTLYRTVMELVFTSRVHFHDQRCLMAFVWAIVGVLMERCVHLSRWVNRRPGEAQAASKQRQFARWLENEKIQEAAIYHKLAKNALVSWAGEIVYLALDSSSLWDRFVIVRIALIYRGRALPLSWMVMKHASSSVAFEDYKHILKDAAAILPQGCRVILLADRGFDDNDLFCLARDLGWSFRIRLKRSLRLYRASRPSSNIGRLMPEKGKALFLHKVWLTDRFFGPVYLALARVQTRNGYEEWAIVSDEPTDLHTFDEYSLRFDLEENFLDDKSNGFQVEASRLDTPAALERLFLVLAVATLHFTSVGVGVVRRKLRRWVDTHWDRGMSYLKIGWSWVRQQFRRGWSLMPAFWLDPTPDPEPALASRRKAAQPKPMWVVAFKT